MLLHSAQCGLHLNVIDYDEPLGGATYGQRNRLLTSLRLADNGRQWETIGPLFYTDELRKLLNWLTDLLANRDAARQVTFREPGVRIEWDHELADDQFQFRFTLPPEIIPPWRSADTNDAPLPFSLTMVCTREVIRTAVVDLTLQIRLFPSR